MVAGVETSEVSKEISSMAKCEHGRQRSVCKECGGGSICDHQIVRSTCSLCDSASVFKMYRRKAAERGIPFLVTEQQFREIVIKPCQYCGDYGSPRGIDRRFNEHSYTLENSFACCGTCNFMKKNYSPNFFLSHIRKIEAHQEKLRKQKVVSARVVS